MDFGNSRLTRMRSSPILLLTGQKMFCYGPVALLPRQSSEHGVLRIGM